MPLLRNLMAVIAIAYPLHAWSEPWLGNRFSQNCAACHAPGRMNVAPEKRRCSLSCQGCHISPSGGGLRSQYGKWNENRWLKTFLVEDLQHEKSVAPFPAQKYSKNLPTHDKKTAALVGLNVVESPETYPDASLYDRRDHQELILSKSEEEFASHIPFQDPWREMGRSKIDAGGDIRYEVFQKKATTEANDTTTSDSMTRPFFMAVDLGLRYRPVYRRLHFVYEGRFMGNPDASRKEENIAPSLTRRSMYVLVDELPYSLYLQAGFYRPLFGTPSPDHTALAQRMFAYAVQDNNQAYNIVFEGATMGASPNVPFANFHFIKNQSGGAAAGNDTHGFAGNAGLRFVTLGLSFTASYWRTQSNIDVNGVAQVSQLEMSDVSLGAQLGPVTTTLSATSFAKDVPTRDFRQGGVTTLDTYTQIWRENYMNIQLAQSNRAEDLKPGSGSQTSYGVRSFVIPGIDLMVAYKTDKQVSNDPETGSTLSTVTRSGLEAQLHTFF